MSYLGFFSEMLTIQQRIYLWRQWIKIPFQ